MKPQLVLLAGPNGAGKSTFYDAFLSESPLPFLNADLLAAEAEIDSFDAARILDVTRDRMIEDGLGFITETVFSDPQGHKVDMLRKAVGAGYDVTLIYIGVVSANLLPHRVDQRVARGGHDVPRDKIISRFERSLENLRRAITVVPTIELFDNSSAETPYRHIASFRNGKLHWRAPGPLPRWARSIVPTVRKKR
jgi:predicted ABC-type ATPase